MNKFLRIIGYNAFGIEVAEVITGPMPSLYFWLGRDAYKEPEFITSLAFKYKDEYEPLYTSLKEAKIKIYKDRNLTQEIERRKSIFPK